MKVASQRRKCAEGETLAYKVRCASAPARDTLLEIKKTFEIELSYADAKKLFDNTVVHVNKTAKTLEFLATTLGP